MSDHADKIREAAPSYVMDALGALEDAGYEAWAVGGCIRDVLLGRAPHDWDITTSATPEQMKAAMPYKSFDTGIEHGTVTFLIDGVPVETTVYRTEGKYSDGRHPDEVRFAKTLAEDLSRRDFTVNAMAWSPTRGIADLHGGVEDLDRNLLRCVGDARERFSEDGLRIMRAMRFAAVYDMEIEADTAEAMHEKAYMLDKVSRERISSELTKMMTAADGAHLADIIDDFHDVVFRFAPELEICYGYEQDNKHHDRDLWQHMLSTMAGVEPDPTLRLAALLHDAGKPEAKSVSDDGQAHYYGHMETGRDKAIALMENLKYSRAEIDEVAFLISVHDLRPKATVKSARRFIARCGDDTRARKLLALMKSDGRAHAPDSADYIVENLDAFEVLMEDQLEKNAMFSMKDMAFSGRDLIEMGWEPGPAMGVELKRLFSKVVDGDVPNDKGELANEVVKHARQQRASGESVAWLPEGKVWVEGYVRSDGVKVRGHWRKRRR